MALKQTVIRDEAEHVMRENQERIKLRVRQIVNRMLNATLVEHDRRFIELYQRPDAEGGSVLWEIGGPEREEIEALFRSVTLKELGTGP